MLALEPQLRARVHLMTSSLLHPLLRAVPRPPDSMQCEGLRMKGALVAWVADTTSVFAAHSWHGKDGEEALPGCDRKLTTEHNDARAGEEHTQIARVNR